eukprot:CAMPEP_0206002530 /NCGR_PEP_ID=MMETSP1464-20131121/2811_1 /ASSEMBLY_ACC=CAM_ASM_001124 /TAXON_ID=119497 /ORGANISM="Exanthemachrysis gayraliae, Strain RCC1523" /LENGTH=290 /DNA_ID=CAMNT_0053375875 /DNA_START=154 /DNA_END=1024 /DNA_ORIENTATION=-
MAHRASTAPVDRGQPWPVCHDCQRGRPPGPGRPVRPGAAAELKHDAAARIDQLSRAVRATGVTRVQRLTWRGRRSPGSSVEVEHAGVHVARGGLLRHLQPRGGTVEGEDHEAVAAADDLRVHKTRVELLGQVPVPQLHHVAHAVEQRPYWLRDRGRRARHHNSEKPLVGAEGALDHGAVGPRGGRGDHAVATQHQGVAEQLDDLLVQHGCGLGANHGDGERGGGRAVLDASQLGDEAGRLLGRGGLGAQGLGGLRGAAFQAPEDLLREEGALPMRARSAPERAADRRAWA